jgi:hypothetical protein
MTLSPIKGSRTNVFLIGMGKPMEAYTPSRPTRTTINNPIKAILITFDLSNLVVVISTSSKTVSCYDDVS